MAFALHLLSGLIHRVAESVVHLLVDAVLVLVPHQAGRAVDGGLQKLACLPQVQTQLLLLLPAGKAVGQLLSGHGQRPHLVRQRQAVLQHRDLLLVQQEDQFCGVLHSLRQRAHSFLSALSRRQDHIGPGQGDPPGLTAVQKGVVEGLQWGQLPKGLQHPWLAVYEIEFHMTAVH